MSAKDKNLLLVSYYFPPIGMGGVQRAAKIAKYFARAGWNVTVLAAHQEAFPHCDASLLDDIPDQVEIIHVYDLKQAKAALGKTSGFVIKKASSLWSRLMRLPDSKIFWSKKAIESAEKIVREKSINYLITTSPPPSVNYIGLNLKSKFDLKWLADFRDPWFSDDLPPLTPFHSLSKNKLERSIMQNADIVTVVTHTHLQYLKHRFPEIPERFYHVPNGYDTEDLDSIEQSFPDKLVITHCGTLCSKFSVTAFFDTMLDLIDMDAGLRGQLRFEQVGMVSRDIHQIISEKYSPRIAVNFYGYMEHRLALEKLAQSWAVIVFSGITPGNRLVIPGKLYEGLALSKPLIGVFEKESPACTILRDMPGIYHLDPDDPIRMRKIMQSLIAAYRSGPPKKISRKARLGPYTREDQATAMARLLEGTD